jgi:hypothetical protein
MQGRHRTERRRRMWAAAGGTGRVVPLGLAANGPAEGGNREKLIFGGPLLFWRLVN